VIRHLRTINQPTPSLLFRTGIFMGEWGNVSFSGA